MGGGGKIGKKGSYFSGEKLSSAVTADHIVSVDAADHTVSVDTGVQ